MHFSVEIGENRAKHGKKLEKIYRNYGKDIEIVLNALEICPVEKIVYHPM